MTETMELKEAVRKVLSDCAVYGNVVKLPPEPLEKNVYKAVHKALENVGGKWTGGDIMGFVFEGQNLADITLALITAEAELVAPVPSVAELPDGTHVAITGGKYKGKKGVIDFTRPNGYQVTIKSDSGITNISETILKKYVSADDAPVLPVKKCPNPECVDGMVKNPDADNTIESGGQLAYVPCPACFDEQETPFDDFSEMLKGDEPEQTKAPGNVKKIIVPTAGLLSMLRKAKEVVSKHPTLAVLDNVLIKVRRTDIVIVATDCIVTLEGTINVTNLGDFGYEFLLPFKFLLDTCTLLTCGELTIELTSRYEASYDQTVADALLTGYNDQYEIKHLDGSQDWPKMPELPADVFVGINDDFIEWLNRAIDTVSKDDIRPAMQKISILIEPRQLALASTNAHAVMEKTFEVETQHTKQLLIDTKIAKALKGMKHTSISWSDTHIAIVSDNMRLIGTIQDEQFPNYRAVFPYDGPNLQVSRLELIGAFERILLTNAPATIFLKRDIGFIVIESESIDYGRKIEVTIAADYSGDCEMIRLNSALLLTLLNQIKYNTIGLAIVASNRGVVLTSESDDSYRALIMPMG